LRRNFAHLVQRVKQDRMATSTVTYTESASFQYVAVSPHCVAVTDDRRCHTGSAI
jgi:hypothetical protein